MTRLHVVVRGHVQGVGFRWFVRESARRAGVAGWVKNRDDGSVEVVASGEDSSIRSVRSAVAVGPANAAVTSVEDLPPLGDPLPYPFTVMK